MANRLEKVVSILLAMESCLPNVSVFDVDQALGLGSKIRCEVVGTSIFEVIRNPVNCLQQAHMHEGAQAALNLWGDHDTWVK